MNDYGSYLKSLREAKGLTLREVEKMIDISNAYLSQLEANKIKQPSPIILNKLSQTYGIKYEVNIRRAKRRNNNGVSPG